MTVYRRTQTGTLMIVLAGVVLAVTGLLVAVNGPHPVLIAVILLVGGFLFVFHSLTVEVDRREVRLRFGAGPIGRRFPLTSVRSVRPVRNRWYYGWGIRWFVRGWLFNVSGLDAVELGMADGRVYRIGTDRPRELCEAIERARTEGGA